MRRLLHFLFATSVALCLCVVPARANLADAQAAFERGDYQAAYAEYLRLADTGDSNAQTALGILYSDGHGVPKDPRVAVTWFRKAADEGNPQAQLNLGIHYEQGDGVQQDFAAALSWYRKAAEQGYAAAQLALGNLYYRGRGVTQDKKEAIGWFQRAADQGNASAQHNLASAYYFGDGAEINYPEAFKLFERAAAQGYGDSQFNLGVMYEKGQGVQKDNTRAYYWWLLASAREVADAARNRDRIVKLLTPAQRSQAEAAASQWKPVVQASAARPEAAAGRAASGALKGEPDVTGTALRVTATYYVTHFHAVRGCQRLRINGSENAETHSSDERNDLALLRVPAAGGATAVVRIGRLRVGEQVTAAGFPLHATASPLNVATGTISSLSGQHGDTRFVQISATAPLASGGGPLFDASGNVMGFVEKDLGAAGLAQATGSQDANFALTSNALQGFLDANGVDFDTAGLGVSMSSPLVAMKAKDVVAQVECWR